MSIRTHTIVECDGCHYQILGCKDGQSNHAENSLAIARGEGWQRVNTNGRHGNRKLKDFCPECFSAWYLTNVMPLEVA